MAEMKPLPEDPTLPVVGDAVIQLHKCVEEHKKQTARGFAEILESIGDLTKAAARIRTSQTAVRKALVSEKARTDQRFKALEAQVRLIATATGAEKEKPTVAAMSQRTAITAASVIGTLAAVPGILALAKFLAPMVRVAITYVTVH